MGKKIVNFLVGKLENEDTSNKLEIELILWDVSCVWPDQMGQLYTSSSNIAEPVSSKCLCAGLFNDDRKEQRLCFLSACRVLSVCPENSSIEDNYNRSEVTFPSTVVYSFLVRKSVTEILNSFVRSNALANKRKFTQSMGTQAPAASSSTKQGEFGLEGCGEDDNYDASGIY
jgi:hypothetical protein